MTDRPVIFSAPMIRALLAGTKTQTRRILKPQPHLMSDKGLSYIGVDGKGHKPRIEVNDRLWVRETWSGHHVFSDTPPAQRESFSTPDGPYLREDVWLWADGEPTGGDYEKPRPGIHMPRWASRLTLDVTAVRIQRLQDISPVDARDEGVNRRSNKVRQMWLFGASGEQRADTYLRACVWEYEDLWNSINGAGSWDANPWVVAYTFTVQRGNIDQIAKVAA